MRDLETLFFSNGHSAARLGNPIAHLIHLAWEILFKWKITTCFFVVVCLQSMYEGMLTFRFETNTIYVKALGLCFNKFFYRAFFNFLVCPTICKRSVSFCFCPLCMFNRVCRHDSCVSESVSFSSSWKYA